MSIALEVFGWCNGLPESYTLRTLITSGIYKDCFKPGVLTFSEAFVYQTIPFALSIVTFAEPVTAVPFVYLSVVFRAGLLAVFPYNVFALVWALLTLTL